MVELRRVESNARQTLEMIQDIAAACREQSEASQNLARNIEQVAQLADDNEHLVRENSELSRYLNELSVQLIGKLYRNTNTSDCRMTWIIYLMCLIALVIAGVTVTIAVRHRRLEDANSMDQTLGACQSRLN